MSEPALRPDGVQLVYVRGRADLAANLNRSEIVLVATETGRVLTQWEGSSPRWSPNGREIASAGSRDGRNGIWVRQVESGTDRFLVETPQSNAWLGRGAANNFEWWPDGQWIAFVAAGGVIGYPSLAATSSEQGRLAACHALGAPAHPMAPHFPIGIYAIPEISMVGEPEHVLTKKKVPYEVALPGTGKLPGARSWATATACSSSCLPGRTAGCSASMSSELEPQNSSTLARP